MTYNPATYKANVKAALQAGIGSATAEDDIAQALADALGTAISELQMTTLAAVGTSGAQGVTAGGAAVPVLSQAGDIT